jgi:hypothetical protein
MGLWFGAATNWRYEANFSEKGKRRAKHQTRIEAIRLCASLLRGSPLDQHCVIRFQVTMKNES